MGTKWTQDWLKFEIKNITGIISRKKIEILIPRKIWSSTEIIRNAKENKTRVRWICINTKRVWTNVGSVIRRIIPTRGNRNDIK